MLSEIAGADQFGEAAMVWIKAASIAIEILAVVVIVTATVYTLGRYLYRLSARRTDGDWNHELKIGLGKSLLIGLEVLVAADVVRTVAMELTFETVAVLGLLVLIRTFLGWALIVEIEGRWPWQNQPAAPNAHGPQQQPTPPDRIV